MASRPSRPFRSMRCCSGSAATGTALPMRRRHVRSLAASVVAFHRRRCRRPARSCRRSRIERHAQEARIRRGPGDRLPPAGVCYPAGSMTQGGSGRGGASGGRSGARQGFAGEERSEPRTSGREPATSARPRLERAAASRAPRSAAGPSASCRRVDRAGARSGDCARSTARSSPRKPAARPRRPAAAPPRAERGPARRAAPGQTRAEAQEVLATGVQTLWSSRTRPRCASTASWSRASRNSPSPISSASSARASCASTASAPSRTTGSQAGQKVRVPPLKLDQQKPVGRNAAQGPGRPRLPASRSPSTRTRTSWSSTSRWALPCRADRAPSAMWTGCSRP